MDTEQRLDGFVFVDDVVFEPLSAQVHVRERKLSSSASFGSVPARLQPDNRARRAGITKWVVSQFEA